MKKLHGFAMVGAVALVLAGCGSSGGDNAPAVTAPVATTEVPASATGSVAGLLTYTTQQVGTNSDNSEPILVGDAVLPVDNTTETSL